MLSSFKVVAPSALVLTVALATTSPSFAQTSPGDDDLYQDEVVVTGSQVDFGGTYEGGDIGKAARAGLLGNLPYLDAPFSSLSFTAELAREQQALSITDLIRNDPTVGTAKGFGNFQEVYILRGFPVFSDDVTYNGLYGILPRQFLAAELVDRVEVFRGANAFLNGAAPGTSGAGGNINIVPKRADAEDLNRITLGLRSGGEFTGAADIGRRFGARDEIGLRANGVFRNGRTAIDHQRRDLGAFALGASREGARARFSADLGYQTNRLDNPRPQITPSGAIPDVPEADANYAIKGTLTDERQVFGAFRGEFDVTDDVMGWAAFGGREGEEANVLANPTADAAGDYTAFRFDNAREDRILSGDVGVTATFATGAVGHRLVASGSVVDLQSKNAFAFNFAALSGNIFDDRQPGLNAVGNFTGGDLSSPLTTERTINSSAAIADTLSFLDDRLLATVGVRYQHIQTETFDFNTGRGNPGTDFSESAWTPAFGIVFKAADTLSVFGNYAENLQPGQIVPAAVGSTVVRNAGDVLDPYRGTQYEAGLKYDGRGFGATFSVFDLTRPNAILTNLRTAGGLTTGIIAPDGEQSVQGLEATVYGSPMEGLSLIGGLTWLDADLSRTEGGVDEGNSLIGVPDIRASLNARYDIAALAGLSIDGRATYSGEQFTNTANTISIDDFVRFDIGASYRWSNRLDQDIVLRARIENVGDEKSFVSTGGFPGSNYLVQSEPRTILISVEFGL
ncbi:TonB-dependent receptor [uncultured Algimonas sp.]|uniref:TonB-dependent receptor n=1 Tax=uncultured Algimonas sp. TaxID=1547920 RepID=UPI00262DDDF9|nr:TonB-dependent receptor [uncultured Algimonas sp.]